MKKMPLKKKPLILTIVTIAVLFVFPVIAVEPPAAESIAAGPPVSSPPSPPSPPSLSDLSEVMPKIKMDWRLDLIKENIQASNTGNGLSVEQKANGEGKDLRFVIPYIRFDLSGKINESTSYRLKFRLNKTSETANPNVDDSGQSLDYAYVDHKMSCHSELSFRFGKQVFLHGGWESYPSSRDSYSYSLASFSSYRTGVGAFYTLLKNHKFNMQVMNNRFGEYNQRKLLYGAGYQGKFVDGMINPLISYHVDPRTAQFRGGNTPGASSRLDIDYNEAKNSYFAIGNRLALFDFKVDLDYLLNKEEAKINSDKDSIDRSYVGTIFYQYKEFRPQLKYAFSRDENNGIKVAKRHDYHAVLEYYPYPNKDYRYHLGMTGQKFNYTTGINNQTNTTYLLGMAGSF